MNRISAYLCLLFLLIPFLGTAQIKVISDIDYLPEESYENNKDLLDIYMPEGAKDVPVIVYFHGGALLQGDKSWGKDIGTRVAESGVGLISVNYRLSPGVQHPAHTQDAAAATAWVIKYIKHYGGDPEKVYVGGHSAGAYLAALLALDSELIKEAGIDTPSLAGAVLISAFLYVEETAKDRTARDSIYQSIWGMNPQDWFKASVSPHLGPNRDNLLLIYADGDEDWRKEQNQRLVQVLRNAGNQRVKYQEVPNRNHLSLLTDILAEDDQIVQLLCNFILNPSDD